MQLGANSPNFTSDDTLNKLYDDLSYYAAEAKASASAFAEASVFADIEKTMAQIRAHRAQLLEEGDR